MAAPPGRKRRPYAARMPVDERRTQLLDAALRVVVERGHDQATMAAIAEAAGVTKPVAYNVFANRGELLAVLLEREQHGALEQVLAAFPAISSDPRTLDPRELITDMTRAYFDGILAERNRWYCILLAADAGPRELRAAVDEARELLRSRIQFTLEWLLPERGDGRKLDFELTSHGLVALYINAGQLLLVEPDRFGVERLTKWMASLVLRMLS